MKLCSYLFFHLPDSIARFIKELPSTTMVLIAVLALRYDGLIWLISLYWLQTTIFKQCGAEKTQANKRQL
ncbi:unnamed protein product [Clonostachys rosea f. rosea IK726]|uniref:Uncharacterized protein n=1 Tax=Clonostachys rosea f. rosea IK726 TaxID=1349383 RepID=A0ACA9U202_BIOOC|nr:unnamed protein product [Clonostachys rosea f. rosea IK726]